MFVKFIKNMFNQNSNDLVKQASLETKHAQNSYQTKTQLINNLDGALANNSGMNSNIVPVSNSSPESSSIDNVSTQFTNMLKNITNYVRTTIIEGLDGDAASTHASNPLSAAAATSSASVPASVPTPPKPTSGLLSKQEIDKIVAQNNDYMVQENDNYRHIKNVKDIISADDKRTRNNWVQVKDKSGISKYGYITKENIFQVWYVPGDPKNNPANWFTTDPIKQNNGVLGCPKFPAAINTIEINTTWDNIKPYEGVYSIYDSKVPIFILTDTGVRDINRSYKKTGFFSCGNETQNVAVSERPSADFNFESNSNNPYKQGCYVLKQNKTLKDLEYAGFKLQEDLGKTSIAKCKRRAEDLGRTFFFLANNNENMKNTADCYVYLGDGTPNLDNILAKDENNSTCYSGDAEAQEDGFMKAYDKSLLPRLYGTDTKIEIPSGPANPTCDHRTRNGCIFPTYTHTGNAVCRPPNGDDTWTYGGLWGYTNDQLKGWLNHLETRNGGGVERSAVHEYINRCKNTAGYEFLQDNPVKNYGTQKSIALYSLKSTGPTGVDTYEAEKPGLVGKIAFINHNGERREYPRELLKKDSGADAKIEDVAFMEVGNYDTRTVNDTYGVNGAGDNGIDGISFEDCKKKCFESKESGGFVFIGSKTGGVGKCQLKHKDKMFPLGLRQADSAKTLVLKMPAIQDSVAEDCRMAGKRQLNGQEKSSKIQNYHSVDSLQYLYYLDGGAMTADAKCDITKHISQNQPNKIKPVDGADLARKYKERVSATNNAITSALNPAARARAEGFMNIKEGYGETASLEFQASKYRTDISGVRETIQRLGNANQQQETINAFKEESNIRLIAESYKFILWSILAILAVMAVIKLKEKFIEGGEEESIADAISSIGAGASSVNLSSEIEDKSQSLTDAINDGTAKLKDGATNAMTQIKSGADSIVEGAQNTAEGLKNGITNATSKISDAVSNASNNLLSGNAGSGSPPLVSQSTAPSSGYSSKMNGGRNWYRKK